MHVTLNSFARNFMLDKERKDSEETNVKEKLRYKQ